MISLWRIFWLECVALGRGGTLAILAAAAAAIVVVSLRLLEDGVTADGGSELFVRYALGGVFALLVIVLLATATGAIAGERAAKRLQLAQVRPVSAFSIAWGKFLALSLAGALVLGGAFVAVMGCAGFSGRVCNHVLRPVMESPEAEAEKMYDIYMADPETPREVKKAKKSVVLRILTQRAKDNYQTVATNETVEWRFPVLGTCAPGAVRLKFSNNFDMRDDVRGTLSAAGLSGTVSNITRTAVTIPLVPAATDCPPGVLRFTNEGKNAVMLRPRQDVELLLPADARGWNMARAYLVMASALALVVAFGIFLGAGLSRPVALFAALVLLAVSEMSPSVVEQYPDQLETDRIDHMGLATTRFVGACARPISDRAPLGALAAGDCIEPADAARAFARDFLVLPIVFAALAGCLIRRKEEV